MHQSSNLIGQKCITSKWKGTSDLNIHEEIKSKVPQAVHTQICGSL